MNIPAHIEDGNITQSMLRKLDELKTYNTDFTFLLSKCNLRAADQVEDVQAYIDDQLGVYFGEHYRSIPLGNRGGEELTHALTALQPERNAPSTISNSFVDEIQRRINVLKDQVDNAAQTIDRLERLARKAEEVTL
ncbi:hypothetical protein QTN23_24095 [Pseudomonas shirazica]|uniref:hypothetical protein n=1 Tax=Pseudomonas shirazica TaxID=1940636 RepID=UPI0025A9DE22|nr:hypothetical protein [Pseudomonas shirazica]MDM9597091.1 hypothetical protein [Pseudomonas shirazica]MDO2415951.1 hypothetical protein [Pseudomonas shirazica]